MLLSLLVGVLGLLTWQGVLVVWSSPDLRQTVTGTATHPSLALGPGASPVLNRLAKSATIMGAWHTSPPFDSMAPEADDLEYDDPEDKAPSSLAVLTAGAWLCPPTPAGRSTTGVQPTFWWPFRYLMRPQLLTRL